MATELKRMQSMRGTTGDWSANDIVLLDGELGVEFADDGRTKGKVGDGVNTFSNLDYAFGDDVSVPLSGTLPAAPMTGPIEFENTSLGLNWDIGILQGSGDVMKISAQANAQTSQMVVDFGTVEFTFDGTTSTLTLPDIDYSTAADLSAITKGYVDAADAILQAAIDALDVRVTALENP
jgi:hypothetical protein